MPRTLKEHLSELFPSLAKNPTVLEDYHRRFVKSESNPAPIKDLSNPDDWKSRSKIAQLSADDFVLVHRTNRLPVGGMIHPAMQPETLRATVHFLLNGPVSNHHWGNDWEHCKYTILVPLVSLDKETRSRIVTFNPADTYFVGSVKLPKGSVVLGRKADLAKGRVFLGDAKPEAVPEGASDREHAFRKIIELGACPMAFNVASWSGWEESMHKPIISQAASTLGLPRPARHEDSLFHIFENISRSQHLASDFFYGFKPSELLDAYRADLVSDLESAKEHPDEDYREYKVPRAQKTLEIFDKERPRIERIWTEGLARKRAENALKGFASKLEASHYNKMYGKGESW